MSAFYKWILDLFISKFIKSLFDYISNYFQIKKEREQDTKRLEEELKKYQEIMNDKSKTEEEKKNAFKDFIRHTNS